MNTPAGSLAQFRFGVYELDLHSRVLRKHGLRIRLQEQPLLVLAALLNCPGQLVTREDLRTRVWPRDTFVSFDHALNTAVKKIRAALSDDADAPRYVETVPRRGYRFIAPVEPIAPVAAAQAAANQTLPTTPFPWRRLLRLPVLAPVLATLLAIFGLLYFRGSATLAGLLPARRPMVAILPFQDLTGDPAPNSFADGLTEEAILQLGSRNPEKIGVIARTSAMKFRNAGKSIAEIARELKTDYVIEGTVRRDANRVRVSARLIATCDQSTRWSRDFSLAADDALTVQAEVANTIASEVQMALGHPEAAHAGVSTPDAYDNYLRGLAGSGIHSEEGLHRLLTAFEKATKEDPNCSVPFSGLAFTYEQGANLGFLRPREAYAKAREAARRAIEINPRASDAHIYLADANLTVDFDWVGARAEIAKALALNANDPYAHNWNSVFLAAQGKAEEAVVEARRAVELDPLVPEYLSHYGRRLVMAGRPDEAEKQFKAALQLDPAFVHAHQALGGVYESTGQFKASINEWNTTLSMLGEYDATAKVRDAWARAGFDAAKKAALHEYRAYLTKQSKLRYISPYWFASVDAQLGEREQALSWLEKAYDERDVCLFCLRGDANSVFAGLSQEPRYRAILKKVGFPDQEVRASAAN
jgi:TolB-like protein/DNA-binding winged helix-turn-helix (wHTH) protein/tetratricopeptide (TPR) repeat protein